MRPYTRIVLRTQTEMMDTIGQTCDADHQGVVAISKIAYRLTIAVARVGIIEIFHADSLSGSLPENQQGVRLRGRPHAGGGLRAHIQHMCSWREPFDAQRQIVVAFGHVIDYRCIAIARIRIEEILCPDNGRTTRLVSPCNRYRQDGNQQR